MSGIRDFEDLVAWQQARLLAGEIHGLGRTGAFRGNRGLRDQIQRASVSVMSNIAEGFGRFGPVEMGRFVDIALGSCAEVRNQLWLACDLGHLTEPQRAALTAQFRRVEQLLCGLRNYLRSDSAQRPPGRRRGVGNKGGTPAPG
jgi:four helix bundle protein